MPHVVGTLGGDDSFRRQGILCCCGGVRLVGRQLLVLGLEHSADGGDTEMQAGAGQDLGDLDLAQGRAEHL
jgi:hypothetical protein